MHSPIILTALYSFVQTTAASSFCPDSNYALVTTEVCEVNGDGTYGCEGTYTQVTDDGDNSKGATFNSG
jgi:hypothetical protein